MILTVTLNPAVDHTIELESFPAADTVARTESARFDAGGKGINVSQYLDSLGTETVATGLVGDFLGRYIRQELDADDIAHDFVEIAGRTRLNTTVLTDDGEYKINHTGPPVDATIVDDVIAVLERHEPAFVVVAGSLPPGLDVAAIDRIADAGSWQTVVDVGGELLAEVDADYALCKPNRPELAAATGMAVDSLEDCLAAARQLQSSGFERVLTSLGGDGALLVTPDEQLQAAALDVDIADTVGAGDAMLSGFVSELAAGHDARAGLARGVAVASKMVSVPGTRLPSVDDLDDLAQRVTVTEYRK